MPTTPQENNNLLMHGVDFESEEYGGGGGCGCFRSLWPSATRRVRGENDQLNLLPQQREETWVVTQFKKLREVSELVAGPKWKNFVRKIGAYFNTKNKRNYHHNNNDFQYDSFNYTLNFDDGLHNDNEQDVGLGFSSRFAPPVLDKPCSST